MTQPDPDEAFFLTRVGMGSKIKTRYGFGLLQFGWVCVNLTCLI